MIERDRSREIITAKSNDGQSDKISKEYAHPTNNGAYGLYARWQVYKYADQVVDFNHEAFDAVQSSSNDSLLDVGCSDGENLISHRLSGSHDGVMVGIDIDPAIFTLSSIINSRMNQAVMQPVNFVAAKAEALPFKDDAFDAAMCLFMLYHVPQPIEALSELQRTVKQFGRIAIATSGPENKSKQRYYERLIASHLDIEPPIPFNQTFDTRIADETLEDFFSVESTLTQDSQVAITPEISNIRQPSSMRAFLRSLDSMRIHFRPVPSKRKWDNAKREIMRTVVHQEFIEHGKVTERVNRKLYVCLNNLK